MRSSPRRPCAGTPAGLSLLLLVLMAAGCAPARVETDLAPTPSVGARIRYTVRADTARFETGRLVAYQADSLVVDRFTPGLPGNPGTTVRLALPTDSVAVLQVRVGRKGNAGRGALIGAAVGLAIGAACAADASGDSGWLVPTTEECLFAAGLIPGAFIGFVVGALRHSDVWAPVERPIPGPPQSAPVADAQ